MNYVIYAFKRKIINIFHVKTTTYYHFRQKELTIMFFEFVIESSSMIYTIRLVKTGNAKSLIKDIYI